MPALLGAGSSSLAGLAAVGAPAQRGSRFAVVRGCPVHPCGSSPGHACCEMRGAAERARCSGQAPHWAAGGKKSWGL